jgi:hypothetical protein
MQNIHDAADLVFHLLEQLNAFDSSLLACVIWNNVTHAQNFIFTRANNMLQDWCVVHAARHSPSVQPRVQEHEWRKPKRGQVKFNVDASFSSLHNRVGIGICIRNEYGALCIRKI